MKYPREQQGKDKINIDMILKKLETDEQYYGPDQKTSVDSFTSKFHWPKQIFHWLVGNQIYVGVNLFHLWLTILCENIFKWVLSLS